MFWLGLVVGIIFTLVFMFELGRYLDRCQAKREKGGDKKEGK